ncbi:MAG: hypothetical protein ABI233_00525 [Chthoniobacterales bacterium]
MATLKGHKCPDAQSERADESDPEEDREKNLTEMEPAGGAHVHVEIGVMHVMETPKERRQVHEHVPPIIGVIIKQHARDHRDDFRQMQPVEKPELFSGRPDGGKERDRHEENPGKKKTGATRMALRTSRRSAEKCCRRSGHFH